jgi:NADP-reducing hydrogenase subunit HndB
MEKITSLEDLNRFREKVIKEKQRKVKAGDIQVIVGLGACGIAAGALETLEAVKRQIKAEGLKNVTITQSGCIGLCSHEPIVEVVIGDSPSVTYGRVTPEVVRRIVQEDILEHRIVEEYVIESIRFPTI